MESSRKKLLDLSLRNRLLNFSPANPEYQDDSRAHKFLVIQGKLRPVWDRLVDEEKQLRISRFNPEDLANRLKQLNEAKKSSTNGQTEVLKTQIKELMAELKEGEDMAEEGHVWVENLSEEAYQKRLRRLKDEAETLEDTTGDSAFFLALGFLKWKEKETRPRTAEETGEAKVFKFAPLVLVKISLTDEGRGTPGRRKFRIVHEDRPQDNQSLKAKLKDEWEFTLPDLGEDTHLATYLASVRSAITKAKLEGFEVQDTFALGFFNFARYRLWLDLDPKEWTSGSPDQHTIVRSIIGVTPLDTSCPPIVDATRDDAIADEVARHQETEDIPIVRDADTSQYSALLYARKGKSIVVIGPPGSGKSQTITNLIATSIANGKRVLFVAQKLPALDVVASRIRDAGLGDFSLHFYSATREGVNERKPVSPVEIHQQLSAARHLLGTRSRQAPAERRAPGLAKKLNNYAASVHTTHETFGESIQWILCTALKNKEDAMTAWGPHWDEALLVVALPANGPIPIEWMDNRSRLLSEIARLRHEAGDFWQGWSPEKLTVLDMPGVESAFETYRRSLHVLAEWCATIAPELSQWQLKAIEDLSEGAKRLVIPQPCSNEFLRAIAANPEKNRLAHELERELAAMEQDLESGKALLNLLPEGVGATAQFTLTHLREIERSADGTATYEQAQETLRRLRELVATTDHLLHTFPAQSNGITAFLGHPQEHTLLSLIVSVAQQTDGSFRRTPKAFLPQLARRLSNAPELADHAVQIADRVDELAHARAQASKTFAQSIRADKTISILLRDAIALACRLGLGEATVAETSSAGDICRAIEKSAAKLLNIASDLAATITDTDGSLTNTRTEVLSNAAEAVTEASLRIPQQGDPRLVQAWANRIISETDARAAAFAHERASALSEEIKAIIGESSQTPLTAEILGRAVSAAASLGDFSTAVTDYLALKPDNARLLSASERVLNWIRAYANGCEDSTFQALREAIRLTTIIAEAPNLTGNNPSLLASEAAIEALGNAAQTITSLRSQTTPGAGSALGQAANRIRICIQAIKSAEQTAGSLTGIRPPTTLRELRSLGASLPTLRALPPLPVGCDIAQMAGEQQVATIKLLAEASERISKSIAKLPTGFEYTAVPNYKTARQVLDDLKDLGNSPLRFFRGRWRAAKRTVKRSASELEWNEVLKAFEQASKLRKEEEDFADDPTGKTLLGSYFRGTATNWTPFLTFAASVESLTRNLDGFERTDRVVAAWRNDANSFNAIATACARYEEAVREGRNSIPDVFDGPTSVFQTDTPIVAARQKAEETLAQIERLLGSIILALEDAGSSQPEFPKPALTVLIQKLDLLEKEIVAAANSVHPIMGDQFSGTPADWKTAESVVDWTTKIHEEPSLAAKREALMTTCIASPSSVAAIAADAQVATTLLASFGSKLVRSKIRPEDQESIQAFTAALAATLADFEAGAHLVRGKPDAKVADLHKGADLIGQLIIESTRAERLRTVISPSVPSTASVEATLTWAVSLDSHKIPKPLIAFCARHPERTPSVRQLLELCREHVANRREAKNSGLKTWGLGEQTIREECEWAGIIAQGLSEARQRLDECAAHPSCTLQEFHQGCTSTLEAVRLQALIPAWTETLGCDPFIADTPAEAIRETVFWVESLQTDRIPDQLIVWLSDSDSDTRIQWWADIVRSSKKWRTQHTNIRQAALPESSNETVLAAWRQDLSSRESSLALALEQIARVVSNPNIPLTKIRAAADAYTRSDDALLRAMIIQSQLPGGETIQTSKAAAQHRAFASTLSDLPLEITPWALRIGAEAACAHLNQLPEISTDLGGSLEDLEETITNFGPLDGNGRCGLPIETATLQEALNGVESAISNLHGLTSWANLHRESKVATKLGVDRICTEVIRRKATPDQAAAAFSAAIAWQKALIVWKENPNLERFRSTRHEDLRAEFAREDANGIKTQNRQRIVEALRGVSAEGATSWGNGHIDQLLQHEASKRRKLIPVRKLVESAGKRMQDLCPCWLATPAAIAQFMAPGAVDFDLVIMDEASQINPEDAWGAIARGSQLVVVGDPKQMPPSSFFENAATDDDHDDEPLPGTNGEAPPPLLKGHEQESILKAAESCLPQVWLNWHYRSLHQGLIAPANFLSYDRRLVLFPSAHLDHRHLGVRYKYIADGVATTGQVRNAQEAKAVVDHLITVAREFASPQHKGQSKAPHSVGVIAMNIHQQETIKDLIENQRFIDSEFNRNMRHLEAHATEPFFVRNLENVQGDERDVIIVSTTYGPQTPGGTPAQRFFPINQDGGERRFNVLITRAKWRMDVFSSLRSGQLTSSQVGVQHMRAFLQYCESGCLPEKGVATERAFDSPFEAHVHAVLAAKGYAVEKQIGVAGYFVDLAIKDPIASDRYVLGIECDGAAYHSSRAARDRDRLREQVLAERGWKLHRIWSTEWFYNNAAVRRTLFTAVEAALNR